MEPRLLRVADLDVHVTVSERRRTVGLTVERDATITAVIPPALDFFNAAIAKNVAVFFITGRTDSQRQATLWNLDRAGFQGWAGLRTRPDNDHNKSIVPFKSGERKNIEENSGYKIIANVGDQESDIDGGHTECGFKLPNPFYFIE